MCDYTGQHFGAIYEDACCIDGYLWDLDSDDGDGLTSGGSTPCPQCNTAAYLDDAKEDAESTSWGRSCSFVYCGAMIIEGALRLAEKVNSDEATNWKSANPVINTFDWPERDAVINRMVPFYEPIEVVLAV